MNGTVVIAGGGPTGLMLACELRLAGVPTVVLERRAALAEVSAGQAIHGRTLEVLRQRGLADRIRPGQILAWPRTPFSLLWLDMTEAKEHEYTYGFPQWRLEKLLEARAVELGADVRRGHELTGLQQDASGVTVELTSPDGAEEIRADYLVGADGQDSTVRRLAGIGFTAVGESYHGLIGDMEKAKGVKLSFDSGVFPGGMFGLIPLSRDTVRLMTIEFGPEPPADDAAITDDAAVTDDELRAAIRRITEQEPTLGTIRFASRFGGPVGVAERYRAGRVLVAGDAAHWLFISGTQSVNTGIHDAVNLGWKLAATVSGRAPDGLLDTYHAERHPVGRRMCRHSQASMALLHPLERISALRDLVGELLQYEDVSRHLLQTTTAVRYPMVQSENGGADNPLLGAPVPDVPLTTDGGPESVVDTLRTGRGVLLDLSDGAVDLSGAAPWLDRVDLVTAKPSPDLPARTVLIRPDGHVAYADVEAGAPKTDGTETTDGLLHALTTWFGAPATAAP